MSLTWGNPLQHIEAFQKAMEEYWDQHPEDTRAFHDLDREAQTAVIARQTQIYRGMNA